MNQKQYKKYAENHAPASPVFSNCLKAFFSGGFICILGKTLSITYEALGIARENAKTLSTVTLIFLAILFTGIGIFDKIAKHTGAGTLVPITGFANSVASPAIDTKAEGFVLGVGAKMFTIAGPVIVYGTLASIIYGVVYWIMGKF